MLYFVAVGLGYILVEIAFIQRFVLFLGHPTYALTVVIFLLMLSSGAGSLFSRVWLPRTDMGWMPLAAGYRILLADVFFLPERLAALVGCLRISAAGEWYSPDPAGIRDGDAISHRATRPGCTAAPEFAARGKALPTILSSGHGR